MIGAYKEGKDLYATIAQGIYKNSYWDNMEHYEDGTPNPSGKKRRSNCKSVLLGIMYGRGAASIAEQIGESYQEAQKIIDDFYQGFPKVRIWTDKTIEDAKKNGYVEDFWGRRRRLPDIQLPKYTITDRGSKSNSDVNPLLFCRGVVKKTENPLVSRYKLELDNARGWQQVRKIKQEAAKNNIDIRDNGMFISQAERQSVNSRVQGGAATMSKLAMIKVHNDERLKKLKFRILLQVHDELIGECPKENIDEVSEILGDVMKHCAEPTISIPFKTDVYNVPVWYFDDYGDKIYEEYENRCKKENPELVRIQMRKEHEELSDEQFNSFLKLA